MRRFGRQAAAGYTLVELAITVSVAGVITTGVVAIGAYVWADYRAESFGQRMEYLIQDVESMYSGRNNYSDLTLKTAIQLGLIKYERYSGETLIASATASHLYNQNMTLGALSGVAFGNGAWGLHYARLPAGTCVPIVQRAMTLAYSVAVVADPGGASASTSFLDWGTSGSKLTIINGKISGFPVGYSLLKAARSEVPTVTQITEACQAVTGSEKAFGLALIFKRL
ncbi:type 4 pilus major pilin [Leptothrix sp. BB-4]